MGKTNMDVGLNKIIPLKYFKPITEALALYPELRNIHIEFRQVKNFVAPYGTIPTFFSFFRQASKRRYIVYLREHAKEPICSALLKNLPSKAQTGIIAHELAHVAQYNECSVPRLLLTNLLYLLPSCQRRIERNADKRAILHGAADMLYEWAVYVRKIPGYLKKRPRINLYYLKPHEIVEYSKQAFG